MTFQEWLQNAGKVELLQVKKIARENGMMALDRVINIQVNYLEAKLHRNQKSMMRERVRAESYRQGYLDAKGGYQ